MARSFKNTISHQAPSDTSALSTDGGQYSLLKIMTIWAIVAIPMPILALVIAPMLAIEGTWQPLVTIWLLLIGGMIWQTIVAVVILYRELDEFTWPSFKARLWLKAPRDPRTGKASYKLFWWLIPAFLAYALFELTPIATIIGESILIPFPGLASLPYIELQSLVVPELVGAWWLLPKMRGVFGQWDFAANAVLFSLYHMHYPTRMLGLILGTIAWTLPSRRFQSIWFAIILHSVEGVFMMVGILALVTGLAF